MSEQVLPFFLLLFGALAFSVTIRMLAKWTSK